jgi:hypothetical protein
LGDANVQYQPVSHPLPETGHWSFWVRLPDGVDVGFLDPAAMPERAGTSLHKLGVRTFGLSSNGYLVLYLYPEISESTAYPNLCDIARKAIRVLTLTEVLPTACNEAGKPRTTWVTT